MQTTQRWLRTYNGQARTRRPAGQRHYPDISRLVGITKGQSYMDGYMAAWTGQTRASLRSLKWLEDFSFNNYLLWFPSLMTNSHHYALCFQRRGKNCNTTRKIRRTVIKHTMASNRNEKINTGFNYQYVRPALLCISIKSFTPKWNISMGYLK